MKSFDEWFDSQDDVGCIIGLEGYAAKKAWDCKQAEVDELQNKIDEALKLLNIAYPESWAYCVDEAINILKGDQS